METKIVGNDLVITVPLTPREKSPLSNSGKTRMAYSSGGFIGVPGTDIKVSVNVTYPKD